MVFLDSCEIVKIINLDNLNLIYAKEKGCNCIYKIISTADTKTDSLSMTNIYSIQIKSSFYSDDEFFFVAQHENLYGIIYNKEGGLIVLEDYPVIRDLYNLIAIRRLE